MDVLVWRKGLIELGVQRKTTEKQELVGDAWKGAPDRSFSLNGGGTEN